MWLGLSYGAHFPDGMFRNKVSTDAEFEPLQDPILTGAPLSHSTGSFRQPAVLLLESHRNSLRASGLRSHPHPPVVALQRAFRAVPAPRPPPSCGRHGLSSQTCHNSSNRWLERSSRVCLASHSTARRPLT